MNRLHPQGLRAILAAIYDTSPNASHNPTWAARNADRLLSELERTAQPEAPAPKPEPLPGCDCPSCGRGHLVEEVKGAGFQKCDHCGFRPSPTRTCSEVDETAPDPVRATHDNAPHLLKGLMDLLDARKIEEAEIRKLLEPAARAMGVENAAEHSMGFLVQETIPRMLAEVAHLRTSPETVHRSFELKDGPLTHVVLKGHPKAFEAHAAETAAAERWRIITILETEIPVYLPKPFRLDPNWLRDTLEPR